MENKNSIKGRGVAINPANRFDHLSQEKDTEFLELQEEERKLQTQYLPDHSKSIISQNDSPDVPFDASLNPYRGCEHGCSYCYARPTHEYMGYSAGLDFETKIFYKENAAELLEKELQSKKWKPKVLAMSGVTDPYQPIERKLEITRQCLQVLARFRNPVGIITKNHLVTRDLDLLLELNRYNASKVWLSITTLHPELTMKMEPRTSRPHSRLEAIEIFAKAGIPVGVLAAPIIPGLNDEEIPAILKAAQEAGAQSAGYTILRLPYSVKEIFDHWLTTFFPERKEKILNRIREMKGGKLNNTEFGKRMVGEGQIYDQIRQLFNISVKKCGLNAGGVSLSTEHFKRIPAAQYELFD